MNFKSFFAELKRRNVYKVAVAYIVAGWALAQDIARGNRPAADAVRDDMVANDRNLLAYQIAEVYALRGETDKAFEWLQIAFDNHNTGMSTLLVDPLLRSLHDDPRYKNFLTKLGLPAAI